MHGQSVLGILRVSKDGLVLTCVVSDSGSAFWLEWGVSFLIRPVPEASRCSFPGGSLLLLVLVFVVTMA